MADISRPVILRVWSKNLYAVANTCTPEEFTTCYKPLSLLTDSGFTLVSNNTVLDKICPDLDKAISCVTAFSRRCMDRERRTHFWRSFKGIRSMVNELCRSGTFQEEYLLQVPCMAKVGQENGVCFKKLTGKIQEISSRSSDGGFNGTDLKAGISGDVCCAFQSYVECSTELIQRTCGEDSAAFNRRFLYNVSSSMLQSHCLGHDRRPECGLHTSTSAPTYDRHLYVTFVLMSSLALK